MPPAGQLCKPIDCIGRRIKLPEVEQGDLVAAPNTGAHGPTASVLGFLSRPPQSKFFIAKKKLSPRTDCVAVMQRFNPTTTDHHMKLADSLADIEAVVRPHLKFLEADAPLGAEDKLSEAGLDSMASIDLLLDLGERFDITIQDDLLTENAFASLSEFAKLIDMSSY